MRDLFIGRFQTPHNWHLVVLGEMISRPLLYKFKGNVKDITSKEITKREKKARDVNRYL